MLEALKKATHFKHTGLVEMVNSLVTKYAPKRNFYGHRAMTAKVCCALLSNNENLLIGVPSSPKLEVTKQRHGKNHSP